jgi:Fe-S-cluster-containing dehydrogenase component
VADAWFRSPLLRVLDGRGRADVRAAATLRIVEPGAVLFVPGDAADTLWFVGAGAASLRGSHGSRRCGPSEHFGSEALVGGASRTARACASEQSSFLEVPVGALRRVLARAGAAATLVREEAAARRQACALLLAATPLGQALDEATLHSLTSELGEERRGRGEPLFGADEPARAAFLVTHGLLELASAPATTYAARGDLVAVGAALRGGAYGESATALGELVVFRLPAPLLVELARRHPRAIALGESAARARRQKQQRVHELADARATRHAFHELERLSSARSLLAIELEACVRCGQCTAACAGRQGTPRIERRGERAVLALPDADGALVARLLLFPHACQHCRDPVCLVECPTAAITRDAGGAVQLREDLCTGCGACAKACPWDAIRMAPRAATGEPGASALVAVKCDLCRDADGPECVSACPTGAIFRAEPERDLIEVRGALGAAAPASPRRAPSRLRWLVLAGALVPPLIALARLGAAGERLRAETGLLAGALSLLLLGQGLVKRVQPVRAWLRRSMGRVLGPRGLVRLLGAHALGGVALAATVLAHTAGCSPHGTAGALSLVFWLLALSGALGASAYRSLPARLSRLEEKGTLREDHAAEREELEQRLFTGLSEQNAALKELARRLIFPYARAPFGPLALIASGRTRRSEASRLLARVQHLLAGHASERLAGVEELVESAVALRVLGARRLLELALGAWLPAHLILTALFAGLLVAHVVGVRW